jgi:hypothetical protein
VLTPQHTSFITALTLLPGDGCNANM